MQFLHTQGSTPDIIALQETNTTPSLRGYTCYDSGRTATLVSKKLVAIAHDPIPNTKIEHLVTEIIPKKKRKEKSVFLVNLYSPPRQRDANFDILFLGASKLAKSNSLLIVGDFNARGQQWGYPTNNHKGIQVEDAAEAIQCTLLTDQLHPTRLALRSARIRVRT